ncbi:MAG: tetratricopeptide repeat protein [candidate division WOR-3 bacterium]
MKFLYNVVLVLFFSSLLTTSCSNRDSDKIEKMLSEKKYFEVINILENKGKKTGKDYFNLAEAYKDLRKLSVADSLYSLALETDPSLKGKILKSYSNIAMTDFMKGYTANSVKYWLKIIELSPTYDINIGFYHLGKYFYDGGDFQKAKLMLNNSLNISLTSSEKVNVYKMLIEIYKTEEKFDTALIIAKKASDEFSVEGTSGDVDFKVIAGELKFYIAKEKYEKKNYDDALNLFLDFINKPVPLSLLDDAHLYVGNIYFELNDFEKAIFHYNKVKEYSDVKVYGSSDNLDEANEKLKEILRRNMK